MVIWKFFDVQSKTLPKSRYRVFELQHWISFAAAVIDPLSFYVSNIQ